MVLVFGHMSVVVDLCETVLNAVNCTGLSLSHSHLNNYIAVADVFAAFSILFY